MRGSVLAGVSFVKPYSLAPTNDLRLPQHEKELPKTSQTNCNEAYRKLPAQTGRAEISFEDAITKAEELTSAGITNILAGSLSKNEPCSVLREYACIVHDTGQAVRAARAPSPAANVKARNAIRPEIAHVKQLMCVFTNILHAWINVYFDIDETILRCMTERMTYIYSHGMRQGDQDLWTADFGAHLVRAPEGIPESPNPMPMTSSGSLLPETSSDHFGSKGSTVLSHGKGSCQSLPCPTCPSEGIMPHMMMRGISAQKQEGPVEGSFEPPTDGSNKTP